MKRLNLILYLLLFCHACGTGNDKSIELSAEVPNEYKNSIWEPLAIALQNDIKVSTTQLDSFAANPETRSELFYLLVKYNKESLFPSRYNTFEKAAESHLINWLVYPTELDTVPSEIALLTKEEVKDADTTFSYYVFKFKTESPHWAAKEGWMLGCVGPYKKADEPYTWPQATFSRLSRIDSVTTSEEAQWTHMHIYRGIE